MTSLLVAVRTLVVRVNEDLTGFMLFGAAELGALDNFVAVVEVAYIDFGRVFAVLVVLEAFALSGDVSSFNRSILATEVTFSRASSSASIASKDSSRRMGDLERLRDVRRLEAWLLRVAMRSSLDFWAASDFGSVSGFFRRGGCSWWSSL